MRIAVDAFGLHLEEPDASGSFFVKFSAAFLSSSELLRLKL